MRWLKKIDDNIERVESGFIVLLLAGMIVLSFTQIVLRNFFHSGLNWGDILLRHGALWVGLLGASLATKKSKHLSIEFAAHLLPSVWAARLSTLIKIISSAVCVALTYYALEFVSYEKEGGAILAFGIPVWAFQVVIPYSFAMISFRFILSASAFSKLKESP